MAEQNPNPQTPQGQNMNAGSGGGPGRGNITRDERMIRARKYVMQRIYNIFRSKHTEPLNDIQKRKYADLVKHMEEILFRRARNVEEYMDLNTLEQRLQMLTKHYTMNSKQPQQYINSSSSIGTTMIPTPGFSHCGNSSMINMSAIDASVVPTRNNLTTTNADTSLLPTGKERSMVIQGILSNESSQQSPANFPVASAVNHMQSVGRQRTSCQMIPTPGLVGSQSSAGLDTRNNGIISTVVSTLVTQQQLQKQYAVQNSSTVENRSSKMCSGIGSTLQQKPNQLSNGGPCGELGMSGNFVQLGNGSGTSEDYLCATSHHQSAKPSSLQLENHQRPLTEENFVQSSDQQCFQKPPHHFQPQQLYVPQQYQLKTESQHDQIMLENEAFNQTQVSSNLGTQVKSEPGLMNHGVDQQQVFEQFKLHENENQFSSVVDSSKAAHLLSTLSNQHNSDSNAESLQHMQSLQLQGFLAPSDCSTLPARTQLETHMQDQLQCQSVVFAQMSGNISHEQHVQEDFQRISGQDEHQPNRFTSEVSAVNQSMASRSTAQFLNSCGATCRTKNVSRELQYVNQQRWLLFLKHARHCKAPKGQCQEPRCFDVQTLMKHLSKCSKAHCRFPRCHATKKLITHSKNCKNLRCPVCVPVRHLMYKSYVLHIKAHNQPDSEDSSVRSSSKSVSESLENIQPPPKRLKTEQPHSPVREQVKPIVSPSDMSDSYVPQNVQKRDRHDGEASMTIQSDVTEMKTEVPVSASREIELVGEMNKNATPCQNQILNGEPNKLNDSAGVGKEENLKIEICVDVPKQDNMVQPTDNIEIKSGKPKINGGVSLTELFTPDQVRQHIFSLRQWIGQSKAKAEKNQAIGYSMNENSCQLCGVERLTFEPPPIYCAPCGARIKRNATYYTACAGEARQSFCIPCYNESRGDDIFVDGLKIAKSKLEKKKNDEETEEWWVQCDKCEAWQHQICALFNGKKNDGGQAEYTCSNCYLTEVEKGERHPLAQNAILGAKDLPENKLSRHLEGRVIRKLKEERDERARLQGTSVEEVPSAEELVIRVVASVDKKLEVKSRFLEIFREENYPTEFPYKSKVVLLFQRIDGVEVCLFGMYVQEFGSECAFPNQRRVYLSYLDSVKYFRPEVKAASGEALRTFVYHEILIGYLEYCKMRGFTSCYIWACPPLKGEDYILYCHPEIQKTPRSDKLRDWYLSMLKKASKDDIVVELTNLYDHFFVNLDERRAKVTASRLPYFDGDYWPGAAEDLIYQMQQEVDGKKSNKKGSTKKTISKRALKASGQSDLSGTASKDMLLMNKLGETICPMKEDFIMVHLQHCCKHCCVLMVSGMRWVCQQCKNFQLCDKCFGAEQNCVERERHPVNQKEKHIFCPIQIADVPSDTKDEDETLESEFFDTRQAFLSLCQGNHYQYDTLRRAKHSSMMILYHLHNPSAPAFVTTCNVCHLDIEAGQGWRCEVCPDYDVCNACYQKEAATKHPHKMTKSPTADQNGQNKGASQLRIQQHRKTLEVLVHASQCRMLQCQYSTYCRKVKALFRHGIYCKVRLNGGCSLCKMMWSLLQLHARSCKESDCFVPRCEDLKKHLRRVQQQSESRRRAAVNEWSRIRAAEVLRDNE